MAAEAATDSTGKTRVLSQNLIALGLTSFFSDISSEMVLAVVPLFLTTSVGFSILGFGLFEGAYQGTSAVFRVWGGAIADRQQRHKRTAATGYTISTATRIGLVLSTVSASIPIVPMLLADRIGKGLRTAPRDALISLSTAPSHLASAFGVHRAMDTAGALLGPLIAFLVLWSAPGAFDAVFVISAAAGMIGVAIIWLFAQEKPQSETVSAAEPSTRPRVREQWREVLATPGVRTLTLAVAAVSLFTVGDAFVYLVIQRTTGLSARYFPLLFVGTAVVYLALAVPVGRLADRVGTRWVFLFGNSLLIGLDFLLAFSDIGRLAALACLAMLGTYYAATDGVVSAMVSRLVAGPIRASGIALVTVTVAVARMFSAGVFGITWQLFGRTTALTLFGCAMALAVGAASLLLTNNRSPSIGGTR